MMVVGGVESLPRVNAMGTRMFLLTIRPELSVIKPPYTPTNPSPETNQETTKTKGDRRLYRALDVGAGIGRVTSDVLLYLFDRLDLVEPVAGFIETAKRNAISGKWSQLLQLQENSLSSEDNDSTDIIQSDRSSN
jgi:protein N-terminal methyltransferase